MKKWKKRSLALLMAGLMTVSGAAMGTTAFAADTQAAQPQAVITMAAKPALAKPATPSVSNVTKGFKISWKKISGAAGYQVWRSDNNGKSYIKAKTVKGGSTTSFTNTNSAVNKSGKKFKYKIRAYKTVNGKTIYSAYSPVKSVCRLKAPTSVMIFNVKKGLKVFWKKTSGADGYQVWRSNNNGKTYIKAKTIKNADVLTFKNTASAVNKNGKKYKYKLRAYKVIDGKTYYGAYSSVKAITRKKQTSNKTPTSLEGTVWEATKISSDGIDLILKDYMAMSDDPSASNGTHIAFKNKKAIAITYEGGRNSTKYTYKTGRAVIDGTDVYVNGNTMTVETGGVQMTLKRV